MRDLFGIKYQNNIEQMSNLIQLVTEQRVKASNLENMFQFFVRQAQKIFKSEFYSCSSQKNKDRLRFITPPEKKLPFYTQWDFKGTDTHIQGTIKFLLENGQFVRVQSPQLKIELSILFASSNEKALGLGQNVHCPYCISIGLDACVLISFSFLNNQQGVFYHKIQFMISQLRNHEQLAIFLETFSGTQIPVKQKAMLSGEMNKMKELQMAQARLKRNSSKNLINLINQCYTYKVLNMQQKYNSLRLFFDSTLKEYQSLNLLTDFDGYDLTRQNMQKIEKSALPKIAPRHDRLSGKVIKETMLTGMKNVIQQGQESVISEKGNFSIISCAEFSFNITETINEGTDNIFKNNLNLKKEKQCLAFKQCKDPLNEREKNAFLNENYLLIYLKSQTNRYLGKYFWDISQKENEWKKIYMRKYEMDLFQANKNIHRIDMKIKLVKQIAWGIEALGQKSVCHRDLKLSNIVMSREKDFSFQPHIIDFGSVSPFYESTVFQPAELRLLTTEDYNLDYSKANPQVQQTYRDPRRYNRHPLFDVWAFGKIVSMIFFDKKQPPAERWETNNLQAFTYLNIQFLIRACLEQDPQNRPYFKDIIIFLHALLNLHF